MADDLVSVPTTTATTKQPTTTESAPL